MNDEVVSFDDESLILVDKDDNVKGALDKLSCHLGEGVLHRAFSILIFNDRRELLLQKRAAGKMLWPLYWSNSCCSHPREGESLSYSTARRMQEELGFTTELTFLYKFQYSASFKDLGSENELCHVYIGRYDGHLNINPTEIAGWQFISIDELEHQLLTEPEQFTPWFKMEWREIIGNHKEALDKLLAL